MCSGGLGKLSSHRPRISVIVPFHNARPYLRECIDGLLDQTIGRSSYEVLFVNNNSTDGGEALVAAEPSIRMVHESKPGSYAARNAGLREATGEVIAFTDPDCVPRPDWLERVADAMHDLRTGIVLGFRSAPGDGFLLKLLAEYESEKMRYIVGRGRPELFFGHTNNMAVRRSVLDRVGAFEERMRGADTLFVQRAIELMGTGAVTYRDDVEVCHLEVASIFTFYKKNLIYGGSNERLGEKAPFRPLAMGDRLRIARETIRKGRLPAALTAPMLLGALLPGLLCYELGRTGARHRRNEHGQAVG